VARVPYCIRVLIPVGDVIPTRQTPWTTWALAALNVVVYGSLAAWPEAPSWVATALAPWRQANWLALVGNVAALALFGGNVEMRLGRGRFVVFYLAGGYVAHVTALATTTFGAPTVGGSGAVAGVLGAYLALYPYSRVLVLLYLVVRTDVFEVPAPVFLSAWFILQAASETLGLTPGMMRPASTFLAYLAGFGWGLMAVWVFRRPVTWD
jgi:membrane associated rhomboid family serine protease